jgi:hypothetical protein
MSCPHSYPYLDMFQRGPCTLCGELPCTHVWVDALDGVPVCTSCGKRAHWSPSSLERADTCERKQGYAARSARRDSENPYAAFGVRAHKIRENYLRSSIWTEEIARSPEGRCVASGIPHWPMPKDPGLVAVELELETDVMGVPAQRKIDSVSKFRKGVYARADDLKTTGKVAYAKSVDDLLDDPQRILYAYDIAQITGVPEVGAQWTYCQRDGKAARPVEFDESATLTRERMGDLVLPRARSLVRLRLRSLEEHERNLGACWKYKSLCEYASHCLKGKDPLALLSESLYTSTEQGYTPVTITLADHLAAQASPSLPPAPAPATIPVPQVPRMTGRMVLAPELETWVEQNAAQGHDVREQAEGIHAERCKAAGIEVAYVELLDMGMGGGTLEVPVSAPAPVEASPPTTPPADAPASAPAPARRGPGRPRKDGTPPKSKGPEDIAGKDTGPVSDGTTTTVLDATQPPPAPAPECDGPFEPISIGYDYSGTARADVVVECIRAGHSPARAAEFLALLGGARS